MSLKFMYITNSPEVAEIAQKYGVERIWIDLETLGKSERQGSMDAVISNHSVKDIRRIKPILTTSELLVRVNPIHAGSQAEIDAVIEAGADMVMLPMWKTKEEVETFLKYVDGRVKTTLLLETKESVEWIDIILERGGFDEIHIGLNDLHISYHKTFMFELLANGTVEELCRKIAKYNIPYGFGGIARIGAGMLPAEQIIMEHYRLGSTRSILSRSFCNVEKMNSLEEIDSVFRSSMQEIRDWEKQIADKTEAEYEENKNEVKKNVDIIVERIREAKRNEIKL